MSVLEGLSINADNYRVIRELGRGGMGVVYLAEDLHLNRQVALKVLYEHLNQDKAFLDRFREEARSVAKLHHPNIVYVNRLDLSSGILAIDTEYVEGQSLDQFRHATRVTPHMAASIAADVLSGLVACHQLGIIHRDIKPSNILIAENGHAKLTDFGLATAYASHLEATMRGNTSTGFYMGTPRYMPVEAWEGGRPEPFWDLYSFGVVLFEMLTGRTAFEGDNPMAIMRKHLVEPLPELETVTEGISPEFCAIVDRLLRAGDPEAGITGEEALALLQETPEFRELSDSNAASTVTLPPPRRRKPRKRPWKAPDRKLAWSVLALCLFAAILQWGIPKGETKPTERPQPSSSAAFPPNDAPVFLEVQAVDTENLGEGNWMVERDGRGRPQQVTGITDLGLWVMDVGAGTAEHRRPVTGSWAAALSAEGRVAHFGSLAGSLLWEPADGRMVLSLERVRERDGERVRFSVAGSAKPPGYDARAFFRDFEANAALQYLLYAELLGRSKPWAVALEARLPSLPGGRVRVPGIDTEFTINGELDEPTWVNGAFDDTGRIGEIRIPGTPGNAPLLVRWTNEAVYLAARVPGTSESPVVEVGIMPKVEVSVKDSGRFYVTFDSQGIRGSRYTVGNVEHPWQCDWETALSRDGDQTTVEVRIPTRLLDDAAAPEDGRRWRINARLGARSGPEAFTERERWGDTNVQALEHGVLLVFQEGGE